ncbi:hypothetical protein GGR52DRAFT_579960 [Hypoxylon sp. FL1284]|nr:hypothetical protein GGR52DRAFT_579960 [Hypoxylon sp. FL1284]
MEISRGIANTPSKRPAITRRSCDQCRSRKIRCDRGSPCSNCVSSRLECIHSPVASNDKAPRQRVLISAQYEQKIDNIAKGIDGIKLLLQDINAPSGAARAVDHPARNVGQTNLLRFPHENQSSSLPVGEPLWDHSAHIIDFVKAVVQDRDPSDVGIEENEILSSLKGLIRKLENPTPNLSSSLPEANIPKLKPISSSMPPMEAVVTVLRWAKDHETYTRISWVSRIISLEKSAEICRKVYFPIDDYSQVDYVIANEVLSHLFAEHVVVSGLPDYQDYYHLCRKNLQVALLQLPLLLPATQEAISALTLASYYCIEHESKASMAWTYISAALDRCLTLGYHRSRSTGEIDPALRKSQENLFWSVYRLEKGMSLRLGRSSNIRDSEITLTVDDESEPRTVKLSRLQGKIYDQLYSPTGLCRHEDDRGRLAKEFARELRGLIDRTHAEIRDSADKQNDINSDTMRIIYLRCDLVCQSSLLALILRAIPTSPGLVSGVSDESVTVAREVMEIHQQCMLDVRTCKAGPAMVSKYINWAILHTPFVPFSILFTRSVQLLDFDDLDLLDRFTASLKPNETASPKSTTHPYQLYELLCQAARLYINSRTMPSLSNPALTSFLDDSALQGIGFGAAEMENQGLLSDWYYNNQGLMDILDNDIQF